MSSHAGFFAKQHARGSKRAHPFAQAASHFKWERRSGDHLRIKTGGMSTAIISRKASSLVRLREQRHHPQEIAWLGSGVFLLLHAACLAVFLTGTNVLALALCGASYLLQSSSPGELHPRALTEPDGKLAPHPALMIQSPVGSPSAKGRTAEERGAPPDPASGLRWYSGRATVCISGLPNGSGHVPGGGGLE